VRAEGRILVAGQEVPLNDPVAMRRRGVLRTYQTPQTFLELSVIENVLLSTADRRFTGLLGALVLRPIMLRHERQRWDVASAALERVGLVARTQQSAGDLSYGQQRMLELARAIAGQPRVILLDEPSAGLNAAETEQLVELLLGLRDSGITLLVVDHKIDFISHLADRIIVLELGRVVAEGLPTEIWANERVVSAYLGVAEGE
jgi:branched-chain amino acid transport system ATP-binding protein